MTVSNEALAALRRRAETPPARFALELRPGQDAKSVTDDILAALAEFGPTLAPISPVDHGVLILDLATAALHGTEPSLAFAAGYALADDFGLQAAEPDLPTPFFPEEDPLPAGAAPDGARFLPGCWVEAEDLDPLWALAKINAQRAWRFSDDEGRPARGLGVVIAQPDTGVVDHDELDGVPRRGGYDVIDGDHDPTDPLAPGNPGHGTGTASVVVSPVSLLVHGSAPEATHMPIRAIKSVVQISQVSVAAAITRAVDDGAHIITMSLGGLPAGVLLRAVRRAVAADVIVLAAAGNCVRTVVWPARYDECLAVAGTNADDKMWKGTCRGSAVDISAPGQNVFKADVSSPSAASQGQGTSYAVALTAGAAALWLAHHGRADLVAAARARHETLQAMFRRLVRATARRPVGWDSSRMGAGIVDAFALLRADLGLGSDRESREQRDELLASVAGLVAETAGREAVAAVGFDWDRFGPELAYALLSEQLAPEEGAVRSNRFRLSPRLSEAIENAELRSHLGLDQEWLTW